MRMQCASEALGGRDSPSSCGGDTGNNHTHFDIDDHADRDRVIDPIIITLGEESDDTASTDRGRKEELFIVAVTAAVKSPATGRSPPTISISTMAAGTRCTSGH